MSVPSFEYLHLKTNGCTLVHRSSLVCVCESVCVGAEMSKTADFCQKCLHAVFDYETSKTLVIPNARVGCVFRFVQVLILLYVVG